MKFEFDHKTGTMQPKKDDQIYFAQSQGGGLIVDDKKNRVKYIIERDGRITKLFGSFDKDNLNFYDMRDARMISERVLRLFGRDHKYTDYHYFLRGYYMNENFVESCSDFLNESIWSDMEDRSIGDDLRKEDGERLGKLEDGTWLVVSNNAFENGSPVVFDDGNKFYFLTDTICIAVFTESEIDAYYKYDVDGNEDGTNMVKCFRTHSSLRTEDDFKPLKAFIQSVIENDNWDDNDFVDLKVDVRTKWIDFTIVRDTKYRLFFDRDDAVYYAIDREEKYLDESGNLLQPYDPNARDEREKRKTVLEHYYDMFGSYIFDTKGMEDALRESTEFSYNDRLVDDAIDELLSNEVIEDTDEYFELDEDGEVDHSQPKFDYQDYCDKYVEKIMSQIDDVVEEYIFQLGVENAIDYADTRKIAEKIVETDGPGHILATDDMEREEKVDGTIYYIYRVED